MTGEANGRMEGSVNSATSGAMNGRMNRGVVLEKAACSGVMVFAEFYGGRFEPVTYELIGKAKELADKTGQEVVCVAIGRGLGEAAQDLLRYPVDRVLIYDAPEFTHFVAGTYAAAMEDAVIAERPSVVLIGATPVGRSLAPRIAVRFRTGLTADCTELDIRPNGDLVQTRPAFGGNIMATIVTRNARPQMATVRPKVMPKAQVDQACSRSGTAGSCAAVGTGEQSEHSRGREARLQTRVITSDHALAEFVMHLGKVRVTGEKPLPKAESISDARVIVAVGRGVRSKADLVMFEELATRLGGVLAGSRPLVEQGFISSDRQVGQSGRTVRPDLYIACGISGAIQHTAGMAGSATIVAINQDKDAPIFETANYGLVGDMYEIVPALLRLLEPNDSQVSTERGV
ncbi:MAG: electron transfer flavoprotein subunit alpha/FixB family protein [Bacillota bacterium]